MTPYEKLFGKHPSPNHWKIVGSKAYVYIPKEKWGEMDSKANSGILLGCLPHGIYKVLTEYDKIIEFKHVRINESIFPGSRFLIERTL